MVEVVVTNDLDLFQEACSDTAICPDRGTAIDLVYCALGLSEAGEVQGKVKKLIRDKGLFEEKRAIGTLTGLFSTGDVSDEDRKALKKELGDLLWYVAMMADELDYDLSEVADGVLEKLSERKPMMWKLWHRLFGWDYVHARSPGGVVNTILRIQITPNGRRYVKPWPALPDIIILDEPSSWKITHLTSKGGR